MTESLSIKHKALDLAASTRRRKVLTKSSPCLNGLLSVCTCVCLYECMLHVCRCCQRQEKNGFSSARIAGSCEHPRVGAGNLIQVLCR